MSLQEAAANPHKAWSGRLRAGRGPRLGRGSTLRVWLEQVGDRRAAPIDESSAPAIPKIGQTQCSARPC
jgi:hypothetical protein